MPDLHVPPLPFDSARAARILAELPERGFSWNADQVRLLEAMFGNSGFLGRLARREPAVLTRIFATGPRIVLEEIIARTESAAALDEEADIMAALRGAKREAALAIAAADIAGWWNLGEVTQALTQFADASVKAALRCSGARQSNMAWHNRMAPRLRRKAVSPCWRWANTAPTNSITPATST